MTGCMMVDMSTPTTASGFASEEWLRSDEAHALRLRVENMLAATFTRREEYLSLSFFEGPQATPKSLNYLSVLCKRSDDPRAADIRAYLNTRHAGGDYIAQCYVSAAIRMIKGE
jgi:hypothetical protein